MSYIAQSQLKKWLKPVILMAALVFFIAKTIKMISDVSVDLALPAATLYLLDFNFYIGSRTFIGSILTLLTTTITYQQIFIMNLSVYVITIISFFALGINTVIKSLKENNNFLFMVAILFIICPYSLLQYANWVGTYDIYLCFFAILCCMASTNKHLHWVCPVLCLMAIFTHYAFVFSYFPAVLAVQIYNITISERKKARVTSTVLGFIVSFISAIYCGFFANNTIKMSRDELYIYMSERLGTAVENKPYIDSYYFNEDVMEMLSNFRSQIWDSEFARNFILFFLPIMILFLALWCYYIIKSKKGQLLAGAFFILTIAVSIALIFLIVEAPRWQTAAILSQFLILFVLIKKKDPVILECTNKLNQKHINVAMSLYIVYNIIACFIIKPFFA